jgi:hypothetical protein
MPVVVITRSPVLPHDQWDELARRANVIGDPPEGLILHADSEASDDAHLSVELWESPGCYERFVHDRKMPAVQSMTSELGLSDSLTAETVTTLVVTEPGLARTVVDDFGNEVRTVSAR